MYLGTIKTQLQNLALPAQRAAQGLWVLYLIVTPYLLSSLSEMLNAWRRTQAPQRTFGLNVVTLNAVTLNAVTQTLLRRITLPLPTDRVYSVVKESSKSYCFLKFSL